MAEETTFNDQSFLLDFFDITVDKNDSIVPGRKREYRNFLQVEGEPTGVMNRFLGAGAEEILNLQTHQIPLLVPYIRIFKVIKNGNNLSQREFIFNDFTTVESIKSSVVERGTDVGLLSFNWNDLGTNPGNSGLSFEASLKLYFQGFDSIFMDRGGVSFSDLLVPGGKKKAASSFQGRKKVHEDEDFQIKAIVGWATPTDNKKIIFSDPSIIDRTRVSLILTLTTHDIDIREDGSVELTLNYIAALEGRMMGPKADLLQGAAPHDDGQIRLMKRQIRETKTKISLLRGKAKQKNANVDQEQIDKLEAFSERRQRDLEIADRDDKTRIYQRLLSKIENPNLRRIFYLDLSPEQIAIYKQMQETPKRDPATNDIETLTKAFARDRQIFMSAIKELGINKQKATKSESDNANTKIVKKMASSKNRKERQEILNTAKNERKDNQPKDDETYSINFFYLGDLIEAALDIIYDRGGNNADAKPNPNKQFQFLLGTIVLYDVPNSEYRAVPLSDLPISLKYFNNWFQKKILEPEATRMPFQQFVRSICSELVLSVLGKAPLGSLGVTKPGLSITTFTSKRNALPQAGRTDVLQIQTQLNKKENINVQDISNQQQYMFLYMGRVMNTWLQGQESSDREKNIFHLKVGADQSIVKKISFSRTDLPYQREARIENADSGAESNLLFSDFYNAEVTMIGNAIYKPGMLVFIDPTGLGITRSNDASLLGIGGYYSVIKVENTIGDGNFETTLSLVSQTPIKNIQKISTTKTQSAAKPSKDVEQKKQKEDPFKGPTFLQRLVGGVEV